MFFNFFFLVAITMDPSGTIELKQQVQQLQQQVQQLQQQVQQLQQQLLESCFSLLIYY
jgi:cell division protein FtsB